MPPDNDNGLSTRRPRWLTRLGLRAAGVNPRALEAAEGFREVIERLEASRGDQRATVPYPDFGTASLGRNVVLPKANKASLRRFSKNIVARRAINVIKGGVLNLPWEVGPASDAAHEGTLPAEMQARVAAVKASLGRPNDDDTFKSLIEQLVEDELTAGHAVGEIGIALDMARPIRIWPFDAFSFRINLAWTGEPAQPRYAQDPVGGIGTGAAGAGSLRWLRNDEVLFVRANPSTEGPYGLSPLEVSFDYINAFLATHGYARRRASNESAPFILNLGENLGARHATEFMRYWRREVAGTGEIAVISGGKDPDILPLQSAGDDALFLKWQELQLRLIAIGFGIAPQNLGLERDVNRTTAEMMSDADYLLTIEPYARGIAEAITVQALHRRLGWTDIEFRFKIFSDDEKGISEIVLGQVDRDVISLDEARGRLGYQPREDDRGGMTRTEFIATVGIDSLGAGGPDQEDKDLAQELKDKERKDKEDADAEAGAAEAGD